jgi:hypothetical protein
MLTAESARELSSMPIIGEIVVGVLVGSFSAFVSTQLALRRYRSERWWDKKYDAYLVVLNSLHSLLQNIDAYSRELERDTSATTEQAAERAIRYKNSIEEIERHITLGTFLLRDDAVEALNQLKSGLEDANHVGSLWEYLEASDVAYRAALSKIRKAAGKELSDNSMR